MKSFICNMAELGLADRLAVVVADRNTQQDLIRNQTLPCRIYI